MNRQERRAQKLTKRPLSVPEKQSKNKKPFWAAGALGAVLLTGVIVFALMSKEKEPSLPKDPAKDPRAIPKITSQAFWGADKFESESITSPTVFFFYDPTDCDKTCQAGARGVGILMKQNQNLKFVLFAQGSDYKMALAFARKYKWQKSPLILDSQKEVFKAVNASSLMPSAVFVSADRRIAGFTTSGAGGSKNFENGLDKLQP